METLILEVSEKEKAIFIELAIKLKTKYEILNKLSEVEEDKAIYNAVNEGIKSGRMTDEEQSQFLSKIEL